jgi:hypothetical protein
MSLSGIGLVISESSEELKQNTEAERIRRADIIAAIYNAIHVPTKLDGTLYTVDDFIKPELAPEDEEMWELAKAQISAANALRTG